MKISGVIKRAIQAISVNDDAFVDGQTGVAFFGHGRALFLDLQVDERSKSGIVWPNVKYR